MFSNHMVRTYNPWNEHLGTINPKPPATRRTGPTAASGGRPRALGGANHVSPRPGLPPRAAVGPVSSIQRTPGLVEFKFINSKKNPYNMVLSKKSVSQRLLFSGFREGSSDPLPPPEKS